MTPFLKEIAQDLYKKYGNDMSRVAMIFPNKRAGIFMNEYFSQIMGDSPLWAPTYISINNLFDQLCPFKHDDPIRSNFLLYNIYRKIAHKEDDIYFDINYFYSWGQQLINDFNNIDKNMVDAERILSNASEIWKLEELGDDETTQILRDIFMHIPSDKNNNGKASIRNDYHKMWNDLYSIYKEFNRQLQQRGEAYAGARCRYVVENLERGEMQLPAQYDHYVFVGFNVLLQCEKRLFRFIKDKGKATFYWDSDQYFWEKESYFTFNRSLRHNINEFSNAIPFEKTSHIGEQQIEFVATSTLNGQAHYVTQWLSKHLTTDEEHRTAIILCDEGQLQAVLHAIPGNSDTLPGKKVTEVNVTKGFPLGNTPAYTYVTRFLEKHNIREQSALGELLDQLGEQIRVEAHRTLAIHPQNSWEGNLYAESYFQCYTTINRLKEILNENILNIKGITLQTLLLQVLRSQTIPFKGEPATGLQIMGMLETRNLDFDEILMLGVNEGNVPRKTTDHSFLPYDLRKAFQLMTNEEESEIYAYNFFRLLQRCKHITYVYNTQGENNCEMSRFLQQLQYSADFNIKHLILKESQKNSIRRVSGVPEEDVQLVMKTKTHLSPSAINHYTECPMKFYFSDIVGLQEHIRENLIMPANTQGSIFHEAAQLCFGHLIANKQKDLYGYPVSPEEIKRLAKNDLLIEKYLLQAFFIVSGNDALNDSNILKQYINETGNSAIVCASFRDKQAEGRNFLNIHPELASYTKESHTAEFKVLKAYLKNTLLFDAKWDDMHIVSMESKYDTQIEGIDIGGFIDRLDVVKINDQYTLRVVDYKTGTYQDSKIKFTDVDSLFEDKDKHYIFQTFVYSQSCLEKDEPFGLKLPVAPLLLFTHKTSNRKFSPYIKNVKEKSETEEIHSFEKELASAFRERLAVCIKAMKASEYNVKEENECEMCAFTLLCNKKQKKY